MWSPRLTSLLLTARRSGCSLWLWKTWETHRTHWSCTDDYGLLKGRKIGQSQPEEESIGQNLRRLQCKSLVLLLESRHFNLPVSMLAVCMEYLQPVSFRASLPTLDWWIDYPTTVFRSAGIMWPKAATLNHMVFLACPTSSLKAGMADSTLGSSVASPHPKRGTSVEY